ncbi:TonB family protein [Sphingomonas sp. Sphisp66]|uniref:TonB family protein n=1 Tax=Sphingomonas sp. Sphisp66 TaxID=3243051 RepID=UPI0039B53E51
MASSPVSPPRLTAPVRALSLLLALLFAALPLVALLQSIAVQLLPAPNPPAAPVTEVRLIPLPPPAIAPLKQPATAEAGPIAPAPIVAVPVGQPAPSVVAPAPSAGPSAGNAVRTAEPATPFASPVLPAPPAPPQPVRESGEGRLFPAVWAETPSQRLLGKHNPPRARYEGVTGSALLACHVLASRRLADCKVLRETPEGYGFGKAALDASADFRVVPPMLDGQLVSQGRVAIPVGFANRKPNRD